MFRLQTKERFQRAKNTQVGQGPCLSRGIFAWLRTKYNILFHALEVPWMLPLAAAQFLGYIRPLPCDRKRQLDHSFTHKGHSYTYKGLKRGLVFLQRLIQCCWVWATCHSPGSRCLFQDMVQGDLEIPSQAGTCKAYMSRGRYVSFDAQHT
jgi:hypothetical protein